MRSTLRRCLTATVAALTGTVTAVLPLAGTAHAAPAPVTDPAALVNTLIGTSGAVDTFPGPAAPFGMLQWSPDTSPHRTQGGGYEYNDNHLIGYSLTHISGPGCGAYGDVPILPTVGALPAKPGLTTDTFSHINESGQAGWYTVTQGAGITTQLTAAAHSGLGTFQFPRTGQANLLLKVAGSATPVDGSSAEVLSDREIAGSVTSGHFCGQKPALENDYTLHFHLTFDRPFTGYGVWNAQGTSPGTRTLAAGNQPGAAPASPSSPAPRAAGKPTGPAARPFHGGAAPRFTVPEQNPPALHDGAGPQAAADPNPQGVYLTFDATRNQTVHAKVGISFTSDANARKNVAAEIPGWDAAKVRRSTHDAWNQLLRRITVSGGSTAQQQQFYTALYHVLLHPNLFSDVNGEYQGFDNKVHTAAPGHAQYANYSGWDIYRSQAQLAALVAPHQTSDSIRSMLNDYDQSGMLPKWALGNGESYVMVGDPADPIIAGAYAFGARDFDTGHALAAMTAEATVPNNIRPGLAELDQYGYLPLDHRYGCCNFYGPVSTQLEYDSADYAIASFARSLGDAGSYQKFATRAQNWQHVFNAGSGYMQARLANGQFAPGFTPGTGTGFVEGTSAQYTPMVPFNLKTLIAARGGNASYVRYLDSLFTNLTNPTGVNADLSNEPSIEIPWEYDYAGAPWKTQQVVRAAQQQLYFDAPVGQFGNDDLGAMSSWYVWSELGMYPETPGTDVLALGSPVFQQAIITLGNGRKLTISAPNAAVEAPYVNGLSINGAAWHKPWLRYADLTGGGTLRYDLSTIPNRTWGAGESDAPPSDGTGQQTAFTSASPGDGLIVPPGGTGKLSVNVTNVADKPLSVRWTATAEGGLTVTPASGSFSAAAGRTTGQPVTVTAGQTEGRYTVTFQLSLADGTPLPPADAHLAVARPGQLWPYFSNAGVSDDGKDTSASLDTDGFSYSAQALAAAGVRPGGTVTADGIGYRWPDAQPGELDNVVASGQTVPLVAPAGAGRIGLLGSATDTDATGAAGTLVVHYTDGTDQQLQVGMSDWTLGAGAFPPLAGNVIAASTPYRNMSSGQPQKVTTYLFATAGKLAAGKTVASVTLPVPSASFHLFAIGFA